MTTIERINKLICEYRLKIADCDDRLQASRKVKKEMYRFGDDLTEVNNGIAEINIMRQAYVTIIADLESIVDLSDEAAQ